MLTWKIQHKTARCSVSRTPALQFDPESCWFFFLLSGFPLQAAQDLDGKFEMLVDAVKEVETTSDDKVAKTLVFANSKCGFLDIPGTLHCGRRLFVAGR